MAHDKGSSLPADLQGERLLRSTQAAEVLGCSRSQLYRLVQAGKLPPPSRISHAVSGWRCADVLKLTRGAAEAA